MSGRSIDPSNLRAHGGLLGPHIFDSFFRHAIPNLMGQRVKEFFVGHPGATAA